MHLVAATPVGWRVEFHASQEELGKAIFINPTTPLKGWGTIPDKLGLGLGLNEDNLKKFQDKD